MNLYWRTDDDIIVLSKRDECWIVSYEKNRVRLQASFNKDKDKPLLDWLKANKIDFSNFVKDKIKEEISKWFPT